MIWNNIDSLEPTDGMVVLGLAESGPVVVVWKKQWYPFWCDVSYDPNKTEPIQLIKYMKIPRY